ncbi:2-amino-4-hydroxy-6-hydroxymethyldihydropteridine diphosphokinase [Sporosarcina sp. 179-K 3D1 HS]|uniref:2-amino-4-hydroxy-6- hydroxymethyldihydropteridine diphosphokinase n=1 Tax=Sporosarcina sp. 179-K 3D1 HS TaxID=3232169 RepID=UPI0039A0A426
MNVSFLSIGSNMGDRLRHLQQSVYTLHSQEGIEVVAVSSIYETAPIGFIGQADFLNMAVKIQTSLDPHTLLNVCQQIESDLGRKRLIRWGPRTIDLDILLYNNENIESENLIIPHPRMLERAFVLVPLFEIAPELASSEEVVQAGGVELWKKIDGAPESFWGGSLK